MGGMITYNNMNLIGAKAYISSLGYNVYYIAVYWSQNYWLETELSDVDYKCMIIPTLDDLIRNSKPVSRVVDFEGWQIDVKDIRSYVESAVKCNCNFLEILYTPYFECSDEYPTIRNFLPELMREMGAFYIRACYGMMLEKYSALRHPYPSTAEKIEKFWYDPKQLHHIVRLAILIKRYTDGVFPDFIHIEEERDMLIAIKRWETPDSEVDALAQYNLEIAKTLRDSYTVEPTFNTKYAFIELSYSIIKNHLWK